MDAKNLAKLIEFSFKIKKPILITGRPGIGKTDIIKQAAKNIGCDLIISHPVVSDPTDYKGLPFSADGKTADFIPFGDLRKLLNADRPTMFFLDDIGQAPESVQAALMQLLLAREINGQKISDHVHFIAATNRRQDKAGVKGLLEPVKSRFATIVELEFSVDAWIKWALENKMPVEIISFVRFRPTLIQNFEPTREMTNSPSPRGLAMVGGMIKHGLPQELESEVFTGAVGEGFANELLAFVRMFRELPDIEGLIQKPSEYPVPVRPNIQYALLGALINRVDDLSFQPIAAFMKRMNVEFQVVFYKDLVTMKPQFTGTREFAEFIRTNKEIML